METAAIIFICIVGSALTCGTFKYCFYHRRTLNKSDIKNKLTRHFNKTNRVTNMNDNQDYTLDQIMNEETRTCEIV